MPALVEAIGTIRRHTECEPGVTAALLSSLSNGDRLAGLEFRVKSPASLSRKIAADAVQLARADGGRGAEERAAAGLNDVLRYTVETQKHDDLVAATGRTVQGLEAAGLRVEQVKIKYQEGAPYKGIHLIVLDETVGVRFEVQVHSSLSLAIKDQSHIPYETARDQDAEPAERRAAIAQCRALAAQIPTPAGLDEVESVGGIPVTKN